MWDKVLIIFDHFTAVKFSSDRENLPNIYGKYCINFSKNQGEIITIFLS